QAPFVRRWLSRLDVATLLAEPAPRETQAGYFAARHRFHQAVRVRNLIACRSATTKRRFDDRDPHSTVSAGPARKHKHNSHLGTLGHICMLSVAVTNI